MVGVQFLQHGQVVCVDAVTDVPHLRAEFGPGDEFGSGGPFAFEALPRGEEEGGDCADNETPRLRRNSVRRWSL